MSGSCNRSTRWVLATPRRYLPAPAPPAPPRRCLDEPDLTRAPGAARRRRPLRSVSRGRRRAHHFRSHSLRAVAVRWRGFGGARLAAVPRQLAVLHGARRRQRGVCRRAEGYQREVVWADDPLRGGRSGLSADLDRKSTRLNSSHLVISYAVFCL